MSAAFAAFILGMGVASVSAAPLELHIRADGMVQFGSGPELNNEGLRRQIHVLMKEKSRPEIRVLPDRLAKFDAVADVLRAFQHEGYGPRFGFTGVSR
jgi:biopolymer transport protein ExbD